MGTRPGVASVGWRLQREIVLLLAWGPAILMQLAHPLVARGVADHSTFRDGRGARLYRLLHTVDAMLQLCFGTDREARAVAARINAIHDRVHGSLPSAAGPFAAGTPYAAHDPALLAWVHATLLCMNMAVYELYVAPLSDDDKDRYCAEASWIEPCLGIPGGMLPRSCRDLEDYIGTMLSGGVITVTDIARSLALDVVHPPAPRVARPLFALTRQVTVALLPPAIREGYRFSWGPEREVRHRAVAGVVRRALSVTPPLIRHWPAARRAKRAAADRV